MVRMVLKLSSYTDSVADKSGEPVAYSTASRIEQLKQAGYTLVSDGFP